MREITYKGRTYSYNIFQSGMVQVIITSDLELDPVSIINISTLPPDFIRIIAADLNNKSVKNLINS